MGLKRERLGSNTVSLALGFAVGNIEKPMVNDFTKACLPSKPKIFTLSKIPDAIKQRNSSISVMETKVHNIYITDVITDENNLFAFLNFIKTNKQAKEELEDKTVIIHYSSEKRRHYVNIILKNNQLLVLDPQPVTLGTNAFFQSKKDKEKLHALGIHNKGTFVYEAQDRLDPNSCGYFMPATTIMLLQNSAPQSPGKRSANNYHNYLNIDALMKLNLNDNDAVKATRRKFLETVNYDNLTAVDQLVKEVNTYQINTKIKDEESSDLSLIELDEDELGLNDKSNRSSKTNSIEKSESISSESEYEFLLMHDSQVTQKETTELTKIEQAMIRKNIETICKDTKGKTLEDIFAIYEKLKNPNDPDYKILREETNTLNKGLGKLGLFKHGHTTAYKQAMDAVKEAVIFHAQHEMVARKSIPSDNQAKIYEILQTQTGHVSSMGNTASYDKYKKLAKDGKAPDLSEYERKPSNRQVPKP